MRHNHVTWSKRVGATQRLYRLSVLTYRHAEKHGLCECVLAPLPIRTYQPVPPPTCSSMLMALFSLKPFLGAKISKVLTACLVLRASLYESALILTQLKVSNVCSLLSGQLSCLNHPLTRIDFVKYLGVTIVKFRSGPLTLPPL